MKAWVLKEFGGPENLTFDDVALTEPGVGEVRVRVRAIAVARTKDVSARAGNPPFAARISPPHVLGTEHAGTVEAVGAEVDPSLVGTRVAVSAVLSCGRCRACSMGREEACEQFALIGVDRPGSYAEYCLVPLANVHPLPERVSFPQAASLAANGPVARAQLDAGAVGRGSQVLVLGAAGALGSTAVSLAHFRGARVIGVDQLQPKRPLLDHLPLHGLFDGHDDSLTQHILDLTSGWGVDCVIDNLGIAELWHNYRGALADMGRIVVSGAIGRDPIPMQLLPFYLRSQSLIGVRTGNRSQMRALWQDVRDGYRIPEQAVVCRAWTDIHDVHRLVESGRSSGQNVLTID